jgi:glyoxylase-like metal-dependent hydrolase (beta-lactamase superfamily II)
MFFEQIATGGCQSYVLGCSESGAAALIDPEIRQIDRYLGTIARTGLRVKYLIDTHTHADHFSATHHLAETLAAPVVMHRTSPAPFADLRLDDSDVLTIGQMQLKAIHTPGHTRDSMCFVMEDRIFTGDTLLIGGAGRTDLPTGDPEALYDSLFGQILKLDAELIVFPAHDYKAQGQSTIGKELMNNPRLRNKDRASFVEMMRQLNLPEPVHLAEALRANTTGDTSMAQMLSEASRGSDPT